MLEIIFIFIAPCLFVWLQYGDLTPTYKISVSAIFLIMIIFFVFKKIFISKWLKGIDQKIVNIETNALSITDSNAIDTNKKAWRTYSVIQLVCNSVFPILLLVLGAITIKAVEGGLIKLFGCLMFSIISIAIGVIFKFAEIYSYKLAHEKDK